MDSFFANLENSLTGSTDMSIIRYRIQLQLPTNSQIQIQLPTSALLNSFPKKFGKVTRKLLGWNLLLVG